MNIIAPQAKQNNDIKMKHWMFFDHISECRQLQILKTYHRPYAKEIELKLKEGVDAKDIEELQDLRDRLGLTRPKEDFIKILQICDQITSEKDETLQRHYRQRPRLHSILSSAMVITSSLFSRAIC